VKFHKTGETAPSPEIDEPSAEMALAK
jgi:hypothetical protein